MAGNGAQNGSPPSGATGTDVVIGGAIATIIVWILVLMGIDTPPTVAAALATLMGWVVGMFLHQRRMSG